MRPRLPNKPDGLDRFFLAMAFFIAMCVAVVPAWGQATSPGVWYTTKERPQREAGEEVQNSQQFFVRKENPRWFCAHFGTPRGGELACIRTSRNFPMLVGKNTTLGLGGFRTTWDMHHANYPDHWMLRIERSLAHNSTKLEYEIYVRWCRGGQFRDCPDGHEEAITRDDLSPADAKRAVKDALVCLEMDDELQRTDNLDLCAEGLWGDRLHEW